MTWVDAKTVRQAARFYASNRPACVEWGNSLDHTVNSFQTGRALCILRALTGNLEVPGGELRWTSLALMGRRSPELELWDRMPMAQWQKRVDVEHKLLPVFRYVTPQSIIQAILYESPTPFARPISKVPIQYSPIATQQKLMRPLPNSTSWWWLTCS